jgi:hypothetical protein
MKTEKINAIITFTEPTLASTPGNRDLLDEFIAKKAPGSEQAEEELAALPADEQTAKASTVFPRDDQGLFCWDYQWRGFFKEAIFAQIELGELRNLSKWTYKRAVDSFLFVNPRRIRYLDDLGQYYKEPTDTLQRPLRAETMQGDRVALARSELLPPGTQLNLEVTLLIGEGSKKKDGTTRATGASITREIVIACLDYGQFKGFSQWRGGGYGRFTYELK